MQTMEFMIEDRMYRHCLGREAPETESAAGTANTEQARRLPYRDIYCGTGQVIPTFSANRMPAQAGRRATYSNPGVHSRRWKPGPFSACGGWAGRDQQLQPELQPAR